MSRHDPRVYIHHMLDHASEALEMTQGRSRADLDTDRTLELSLVRLMEVVGEASAAFPKTSALGIPMCRGVKRRIYATG